MPDKNIHIVFQVINFIKDPSSKKYKLLPIDKLILITLASHKGSKGIFPSQQTLAEEVGVKLRHLQYRLCHLEKSGLISIEKKGRSHHYDLQKLSTGGALQCAYQGTIDALQCVEHMHCSASDTCTTVRPNNKENNKENRERGRKRRASPLSDDFIVSKDSSMKAKELGFTEDEANIELDKFKNHYIENGEEKSDWNLVLQNWFIRAFQYKASKPTAKPKAAEHVRAMPKEFEQEETIRRGDQETATRALGEILNGLKGLNFKGGINNGLGREGKRGIKGH